MSAYGYEDVLAMVESDLGQTITYNGGEASYPCIAGDRTEGLNLDFGGYDAEADLVMVVRSSLLTPEPQATVTIDSRTLRIKSAIRSPCGTFYVLNLVDNNRGV